MLELETRGDWVNGVDTARVKLQDSLVGGAGLDKVTRLILERVGLLEKAIDVSIILLVVKLHISVKAEQLLELAKEVLYEFWVVKLIRVHFSDPEVDKLVFWDLAVVVPITVEKGFLQTLLCFFLGLTLSEASQYFFFVNEAITICIDLLVDIDQAFNELCSVGWRPLVETTQLSELEQEVIDELLVAQVCRCSLIDPKVDEFIFWDLAVVVRITVSKSF